jgi:hypothetical protein
LNYTAALSPVPYWVTNSATTITTTSADDPILQNTYSFTYDVGPLLPDANHVLDPLFPTSYSLPFTVTLVSCTTGSITPNTPGPFNFTYFIDGTQAFFTLPTFTVLPATCPYTYSIDILMADNITPTPTWINNSYTSTSPSFDITSFDQTLFGTYYFYVNAFVDGRTLINDTSIAFSVFM